MLLRLNTIGIDEEGTLSLSILAPPRACVILDRFNT